MRDLMAIIRDNKLVARTLREPATPTNMCKIAQLRATSPYLNKPLRTLAQVEREDKLRKASRGC